MAGELEDSDKASKCDARRAGHGSGWLVTGIILSLLYAGALLWLSGGREKLWTGLSAAEANELGDFLSGAFAPLAFLWLVVAVCIQAQELRAQRQELALTREELKLTRAEAAETRLEIRAQAEAARATAAFAGQQTLLIRTEAADREAQAMMETLRIWLTSNNAGPQIQVGSERKELGYLWFIGTPGPLLERSLEQARAQIEDMHRSVNQSGSWGSVFAGRSADTLREFIALLEDLMVIPRDASPSTKRRIELLRVADMASNLKQFEEAVRGPAQ